MIKNKRKFFSVGLLFILIVIIVTVLIKISLKRETGSPSHKEQIPIVSEIKINSINNQNENNSIIESHLKTNDDLTDRLFDELVQIDAALALNTIKYEIELKKSLENLVEHDKKRNEKWDLPNDVVKKTTTNTLFLHFITSPMVATLIMVDDLEIAVQRLLNSSSTLNEFYMRQDMAEGALKMYREYDFSPQSISDENMIEKYSRTKTSRESPLLQKSLKPENILKTKIAFITMNIMYADMILLSPQFFPKLKGHEIEYLNVLMDRYENISKLREVYGEDFAPALRGVPDFCLKMAKNLDEQFYNTLHNNELRSDAERKRFYEDVKNFLEKQNDGN